MNDWSWRLTALLIAVGGILAVATVASMILRARAADGEAHPVSDTIRTRTLAWWAMVGLMALALVFGPTGVILLFALCSFSALREFMTLTRVRRSDHPTVAAAFFLVFPAHYLLLWMDWYELWAVFIPVYAFLFLPIVSALRGEAADYLDRVAEIQWALMVCVFCLSHVPALLLLKIEGFEGANILLIAWLLFVVQLFDVAQYVWGKLVGRRPVAPALSPSKTVEGTAGGVATATVAGAGFWWMTPFAALEAAAVAFVLAVLGFLGSLVMSAIKRDRGVKDWSHLIPGHGGFIDRLDSVIFSAPVFFHIVRFGWADG